MKQDFEQFFQANERRVHYQIHLLGIKGGWYDDFYTEGIFAMWQAYREFDETKGNLGTYINYRIRYRLIDLSRKLSRKFKGDNLVIEQGKTELTDGAYNRNTGMPIVNIPSITMKDPAFWDTIREQLTDNQWKWVHYFIIADLSIQEIMEIENVSADAVKGWGRAVRHKLRNEEMRSALNDLLT